MAILEMQPPRDHPETQPTTRRDLSLASPPAMQDAQAARCAVTSDFGGR